MGDRVGGQVRQVTDAEGLQRVVGRLGQDLLADVPVVRVPARRDVALGERNVRRDACRRGSRRGRRGAGRRPAAAAGGGWRGSSRRARCGCRASRPRRGRPRGRGRRGRRPRSAAITRPAVICAPQEEPPQATDHAPGRLRRPRTREATSSAVSSPPPASPPRAHPGPTAAAWPARIPRSTSTRTRWLVWMTASTSCSSLVSTPGPSPAASRSSRNVGSSSVRSSAISFWSAVTAAATPFPSGPRPPR